MNLRLVANDAKSRIGALRRPRDNTPTDMARSLARVEASRKESATVSVRWAQEATLLQNPTQVSSSYVQYKCVLVAPLPSRLKLRYVWTTTMNKHYYSLRLPKTTMPLQVLGQSGTRRSKLQHQPTVKTRGCRALASHKGSQRPTTLHLRDQKLCQQRRSRRLVICPKRGNQ
jgi:hypothetical protein